MVSFGKWLAKVFSFQTLFGSDSEVANHEHRSVVMYQLTPANQLSPWEPFEADLYHQWDSGVTHSVFGFYQAGSPVGLAKYWTARLKGSGRERVLKVAETLSVKIILSIGGPGDTTWSATNATVYMKTACDYARMNQFNGIDFQVEGFVESTTSAAKSAQWLIDASRIAHQEIGYVMHTPHARYFTPPAMSRIYGNVVTGARDYVSQYMIRYFNEATMAYNTYDDIFRNNLINENSIAQIAKSLGSTEMAQFGVVKAYAPKTVQTGFVSLENLRKWVCRAEQDPEVMFTGSIGFWTRDYMNSRFGFNWVKRRLAGFGFSCISDNLIHSTSAPTTTAETTSTMSMSGTTTTNTTTHSGSVIDPIVVACKNHVLDTPACKTSCAYYHKFNRNCRGGSATLQGLISCVQENVPKCFPLNNHSKML